MKSLKLLFILVYSFSFTLFGYSQDSKKILTVSTNQAKLTETEKTDSKILKVLNNGDKVEFLEIIFPSGIGGTPRFKVKYQEFEGFITSYFIKPDIEIDGEISRIKDLENAKIEAIRNEQKLIEDSIKEVRRKEEIISKAERLSNLKIEEEAEIRRNDSIAAIMLKNAKDKGQANIVNWEKENSQEYKARKDKFIKKYGQINGEKIAKKLIWIGMKEEMLLDSWGYPEDVNTTVTRSGTRKQYVYSISQYVYVVNGIVDAWQN